MKDRELFHPEAGDITVDCDHLVVENSDLKLIGYTAPAGSEDARRLELVGALGLQSFEEVAHTTTS